MGSEALKNKATVGGLRPIEQYFTPIGSSVTGEFVAARSSFRMNSSDKGILFAADYMPLLEKYLDRASYYMGCALCQIADTMENFAEREINLDYLTLPLPVNLLKARDFKANIIEATAKLRLNRSKICIELPSYLYNETDGKAAEMIKSLQKDEFLVMIDSFGGTAATSYRLAEFEANYVLLDPALTALAAKRGRRAITVKSMVSLASDLGTSVIATNVANDDEGEAVAEAGCSNCTGAFVGSEVSRQYFRIDRKE